MKNMLEALRACAEPTRLRILYLCSQGELAVGDIATILGMSQPRISKHLRILTEADLLSRYVEGNFAFYRASEASPLRELRELIFSNMQSTDEQLGRDNERLQDLRSRQSKDAEEHFDNIASEWDRVRQMYGGDATVEDALLSVVSSLSPTTLIDIGTGTGRILELLSPIIQEGIGIDRSREMIQIARRRLEGAGLKNCLVRLGDMYHLPLSDETADVAILHLVLHYAREPQHVIKEVARALRPTGTLIVVDFEKHDKEWLREEMNHARLGFQPQEVKEMFERAGLTVQRSLRFPAKDLTIRLWRGVKPL
jgi:ubiquinone/menaquinone biosynthesis C-methylase UbiE/predicted transcriptional regulator